EGDAIGFSEKLLRFAPQFCELVLCPRHNPIVIIIAPRGLGHTYRSDSESKWDLMVCPTNSGNTFWLRLNDCLAQGMFHGDGELRSISGVAGFRAGSVSRLGRGRAISVCGIRVIASGARG